MTSPNIQAAEILEAAACVIRLPGWWTQGAAAKTADGDSVRESSPFAVCFCASGATGAAASALGAGGDLELLAWRALGRHLGWDVVNFNDTPGRAAIEVSDALLLAADKLRGAA